MTTTSTQIQQFIQAFKNPKVHYIIVVGSGGSGKTYTITNALNLLDNEHNTDKTRCVLWDQFSTPIVLRNGYEKNSYNSNIDKLIITTFDYNDFLNENAWIKRQNKSTCVIYCSRS